jgi:hypothetical protein
LEANEQACIPLANLRHQFRPPLEINVRNPQLHRRTADNLQHKHLKLGVDYEYRTLTSGISLRGRLLLNDSPIGAGNLLRQIPVGILRLL